MWNDVAIVENSLVVPQRAKHRTTIWSRNSIPRYLSKRTENRETNIYANVHCSIIHNSQKVKTTQMPTKKEYG